MVFFCKLKILENEDNAGAFPDGFRAVLHLRLVAIFACLVCLTKATEWLVKVMTMPRHLKCANSLRMSDRLKTTVLHTKNKLEIKIIFAVG